MEMGSVLLHPRGWVFFCIPRGEVNFRLPRGWVSLPLDSATLAEPVTPTNEIGASTRSQRPAR